MNHSPVAHSSSVTHMIPGKQSSWWGCWQRWNKKHSFWCWRIFWSFYNSPSLWNCYRSCFAQPINPEKMLFPLESHLVSRSRSKCLSENAHNNREAFYLLERGTRWLGHYQVLNVKNALDRGKLAKMGKLLFIKIMKCFPLTGSNICSLFYTIYQILRKISSKANKTIFEIFTLLICICLQKIVSTVKTAKQ